MEHNPSYSDVQILLKELFRADGRKRIFENDAGLTQQAGGECQPLPAADPHYDYNVAGDMANRQTVCWNNRGDQGMWGNGHKLV